jgi:hypothetical protein
MGGRRDQEICIYLTAAEKKNYICESDIVLLYSDGCC